MSEGEQTITVAKDDLKAIVREILDAVKDESPPSPPPETKLPHGEDVVTITATPEEKVLSDPTGGFYNFGHFCRDIFKANPKTSQPMSEALTRWGEACAVMYKTAGHMEESDLTQGGHLVPEQFMNELLTEVLEESIVRKYARKIPMGTNRIAIPAVDVSSHATNFFGGVQIYRPDEAGQKTESKPKLGKIYLQLHKLAGLVYVSDELLEDSVVSLGPVLSGMFGEAIAFTEDDDFLNGTGAGMALGAFNTGNPSLIDISGEDGQDADTIVSENILNVWQRVAPACHGKAVWMANNDTFTQLATLVLSIGTAGVPVWLPANGLAGSPHGTILGRPLILTEKMQTLGDAGDLGCADFSKYFIAEKGGIKFATSIHLRFDYDETAFRFLLRYDGRPSWLNTMTPKYSSNTVSPFVRLAARA